MTSDSTPAFEIEKEALKTEIETASNARVDHFRGEDRKTQGMRISIITQGIYSSSTGK